MTWSGNTRRSCISSSSESTLRAEPEDVAERADEDLLEAKEEEYDELVVVEEVLGRVWSAGVEILL